MGTLRITYDKNEMAISTIINCLPGGSPYPTYAQSKANKKRSTASAAGVVEQKASNQGTVITERLVSTILRKTRTGLDSNRSIKIYLPPGYAKSGKTYPVIYYCHSIFQSPEKMFENGKLLNLLERGFASGTVQEFIFVVGDYTSPTTGSLYENSPATGRWLDYTIQELVPFIDSRFRTIRRAESRALAGDMMGGRGALLLAMQYPEIFSVVYAMNPLGTGPGVLPIQSYPNWQKIHEAKSFSDLSNEHISQIFITMAQAFVPNPNRPPFYCDFIMEMEEGKLTYNAENARKQIAGFSLYDKLDDYAENLRKLRGIAFDWSRYDPIQDHIHGTQEFTRKLDRFGIEHEAEEYRGVYWTQNWAEDGRFYARLLPFLQQHLLFEVKN
jgi:enterochelin esterase-like enzyme